MLAQTSEGYVIVMLTDRGVWRVLLGQRGEVLHLMTGTAAMRQAQATHAIRAADVVLTSAFGLRDGRLVDVLFAT